MGLDWILTPLPSQILQKMEKKLEEECLMQCRQTQVQGIDDDSDNDWDDYDEDCSEGSDGDEEVTCARVGSYSGVHVQRREWTKAALKYIDDKMTTEPSDSLQLLRATLQRWIEPRGGMPTSLLNYGVIPPLVPLPEDGTLLKESFFTIFHVLSSFPVFLPLTIGKPHIAIQIAQYAAHLDDNRSQVPLEALRTLGFPDELIGLYVFVNHSDCDGCFTPLDTQRAWTTFQAIESYFDEDMRSWASSYMNLCKTAMNRGCGVLFC